MEQILGYRHVHLDFHTSEHIPDVGTEFSKEQFKDMLKIGHLDSITLFSKCHHGYSYHPTKVGKMHPSLKFNLLQEQITACKEIGVSPRIYISAGWDEYYRKTHPGSEVVVAEGISPFTVGYKLLCFNTDYVEYLCRQIEEVVTTFDCGGLFVDIAGAFQCVCQKCQMDMFSCGLDPQNPDNVSEFAMQIFRKYLQRTLAAARIKNTKMPIFQNGGHITKGNRELLEYVSHLEVESLPTGGWGYDHFPASAKYVAGLGMDFLGMTGKFHTSWGEFGGFKHPNALRYETSLSLACGAKCSIGDQLHPRGVMNSDTYHLIGSAYIEVERKQQFCENALPVSEIALLSTEAALFKLKQKQSTHQDKFIADIGAVRMLLECHALFDVIDTDMNFDKYKVIIVPDECCLDPQTAEKLKVYLKNGGRLILSYRSGMRPDSNEFYFDIGSCEGDSVYNPTYIQMRPEMVSGDLIGSLFVAYKEKLEIQTDGKILADSWNPYFNRTLEHFCSHHQD